MMERAKVTAGFDTYKDAFPHAKLNQLPRVESGPRVYATSLHVAGIEPPFAIYASLAGRPGRLALSPSAFEPCVQHTVRC
jgi:hypothetical protein